ncbi:hypothetical protein BGZ96_002805 [Linnemannia gamsii]|uniref:FAD-binding domain-containing protein n=1 Tax=Linnemannia gamsii TaxID=64522 RepID=A0ABQ7K8H9_9FUNG|nr:hypothetical protein BGZ96_002805 [Linnemannia gamsii]
MSFPAESKTDRPPIPTGGFKGCDLPPVVTDKPPRVLIAGAGLGGLFLGILLENSGIPYEIFERSAEIRPLGSIMCLSPNILPAFEQLGLLDELMSFSKPSRGGTMLTDKLKLVGKAIAAPTDLIGYDRILLARPELYTMLFSNIPKEKIRMSKKVLSFQQNHEGVMLRFSDNTTIHGDILVGADGAHSAVRQHLYKTLGKQGLLPDSDTKEMCKGYISLVGTTDALDPEKYPGVLEEDSESYFVVGDKNTPYTVGVAEVADEQFKSSDWIPQQNQKMMDSIRHFKTPYGTLGDLFDVTPIERVSKVGAGAVNAMQDAVLLANHLYDIYPTSFENIKRAFSSYKDERFDAIKDQYPQSYMSAKLIYGHTLSERIVRHVVFNWLPKGIQHRQFLKDTAYRPQANFLPQAPKRGSLEVIPQRPSIRIPKEEGETRELKKQGIVVPL